jgi:hydroxymethylpyrimidine pyrophosphatase-like HAD family hydrolase
MILSVVLGADTNESIEVRVLVLVDVDGTLALRKNRNPFDWGLIHTDQPNLPVVKCIRALSNHGLDIAYVTGREEFLRESTMEWLRQHVGVNGQLIMRETGDHRPDVVIKAEFIENGAIDPEQVFLVFDDRDSVVKMWRHRFGFVCFQVAEGSF